MRDYVGARLLAPLDAELDERIAWLIQVRWLAVVGCLAAIIVGDRLLPSVLPVVPLTGIAIFVGVYNVLFYVYSHALRAQTDVDNRLIRSVRFAYVQFALDLVCLTLLLHFAGGVENPFATFYVLHVIIASILLSRRAALGYAAFASVLYVSMIVAEGIGLIPHIHLVGMVDPDRYHREIVLLGTSTAFTTTLFVAAIMASAIVAQLRRRDKELVNATQRYEARAEELADLNSRLQEADEMRRIFILTVTHELRAPLAAIQSYLRLIKGGYVPPAQQAEIIGRAEQRAGEQLARINDLLILGQLQDRRKPTGDADLGEVLAEVLDTLRSSALEKGLTIRVTVDPEPTTITADREQIGYLWTNLISNAIRYTPAGRMVEVELSQGPAYIKGLVRDDGIGIPPEEHERIFEEFYRTDEAKKMVQYGTGLGLAIAKRIVASCGGRIWAESSPGSGATFTFILPKPTSAAGSVKHEPEQRAASHTRKGGDNLGSSTTEDAVLG